MSITTIRLPDELKSRVALAAERAGTSGHGVILEAIAEMLSKQNGKMTFMILRSNATWPSSCPARRFHGITCANTLKTVWRARKHHNRRLANCNVTYRTGVGNYLCRSVSASSDFALKIP
jgi:hypothetical protein